MENHQSHYMQNNFLWKLESGRDTGCIHVVLIREIMRDGKLKVSRKVNPVDTVIISAIHWNSGHAGG